MSRDLESGGESRERVDAEKGSGVKYLPEAGCLLGRVGAGEVVEQEKGDFGLQRSLWNVFFDEEGVADLFLRERSN